MITRFKSALNRIEAEEDLVKRTEASLQKALAPGQPKIRRSRQKPLEWLFFPDWNTMKGLPALAGLALFLIAGSAGAYRYYETPAAYVSLDINPSVELGINGLDRVVFVKAYNADGEIILTGLDLEGLTVDEAVRLVLASASERGYIAEDGSTIVSITSETDEDDSGLAEQLENEAVAGAEEGLTDSGKEAEIVTDNVALSMREEAETAGITPGKLNLINKLQEADPEASIDEYKDASVKEIIRDTQAAHGKEKKEPGHPDSIIDDESSTDGNVITDSQGKPDEQGQDDDKGKPDAQDQANEQGNADQQGKADEHSNADKHDDGDNPSPEQDLETDSGSQNSQNSQDNPGNQDNSGHNQGHSDNGHGSQDNQGAPGNSQHD